MGPQGLQFRGISQEHLRIDLDLHGETIQRALLVDVDLIIGGHLGNLHDLLLDLRGEDIDSADDQHVIGPAEDTRQAAMGPAARARLRMKKRPITRAVPQNRRRPPHEIRQNNLALLPVFKNFTGRRIDDLDDIGVLPDVHVLAADTLEGNPRPIEFTQTIRIEGADPEQFLDLQARVL